MFPRVTVNDRIASPRCPTPEIPYRSPVTSTPLANQAELPLLLLLNAAVFVHFAIVIIVTNCIHDWYTACIRAYYLEYITKN